MTESDTLLTIDLEKCLPELRNTFAIVSLEVLRRICSSDVVKEKSHVKQLYTFLDNLIVVLQASILEYGFLNFA